MVGLKLVVMLMKVLMVNKKNFNIKKYSKVSILKLIKKNLLNLKINFFSFYFKIFFSFYRVK